MISILPFIIVAATTLSVVAFGVYAVAMRTLPVDRRPKVPVLDGFGKEIGVFENPGFAETEDENE